jgi:hypothetical protein
MRLGGKKIKKKKKQKREKKKKKEKRGLESAEFKARGVHNPLFFFRVENKYAAPARTTIIIIATRVQSTPPATCFFAPLSALAKAFFASCAFSLARAYCPEFNACCASARKRSASATFTPRDFAPAMESRTAAMFARAVFSDEDAAEVGATVGARRVGSAVASGSGSSQDGSSVPPVERPPQVGAAVGAAVAVAVAAGVGVEPPPWFGLLELDEDGVP